MYENWIFILKDYIAKQKWGLNLLFFNRLGLIWTLWLPWCRIQTEILHEKTSIFFTVLSAVKLSNAKISLFPSGQSWLLKTHCGWELGGLVSWQEEQRLWLSLCLYWVTHGSYQVLPISAEVKWLQYSTVLVWITVSLSLSCRLSAICGHACLRGPPAEGWQSGHCIWSSVWKNSKGHAQVWTHDRREEVS